MFRRSFCFGLLAVEKRGLCVEQIPAVKELFMRYFFTLSERFGSGGSPALSRELSRYSSSLRFWKGDREQPQALFEGNG